MNDPTSVDASVSGKNRRFFFWLLILLIGFGALYSVELFSRYLRPFQEPKESAEVPELGWMYLSSKMFPEKQKNKIRILMLGGSYTYPDYGYVSFFEKEIKQCNDNVQVINLGVPGYGTAQEYLMWSHFGKDYDPDIVVLSYAGGNDLADNLDDIYYGPQFSGGRASFELENGELKKVLPSKIKRVLVRHSNLFRYLESVFAYKLPEVFGVYLYENLKYFMEFYTQPLSERAKNGIDVTKALIQKLDEEVKAKESRLIVFGFDNAFTVEKELQDKLVAENGSLFANADIHFPVRAIEEFSKEKKFSFLNLTKVF